MLTSGTPFSRAGRADGIQSTITSAPPPAITCGGAMSGPPGLMVDIEAFFLVQALVLGDVVAGELGLRDPFELQRQLSAAMRALPNPAISERGPCQPHFLHVELPFSFAFGTSFPLFLLSPAHAGSTDART
jgi:hypothetical protein